eukprot:GHVN01067272.1.p1 GENE.GHVN01067272.1~~GHVN01067272.1.p1  ORF type:complete len:1435 (-),score=228.76 GHVN01067272.1:3-4307(-)
MKSGSLKEDSRLGCFVASHEPLSYASYKDLIKDALSVGNVEEARRLRSSVSLLCAVTDEFWLSWIEDERQIAEETVVVAEAKAEAAEAKPQQGAEIEKSHSDGLVHLVEEKEEEIVQLYERAVKSAPSVNIWLEYLKFLRRIHAPPHRVRQAHERAVESVGLHPNEGSKIWASWRALEINLLRQENERHENSTEECEISGGKRERLIRELLLRVWNLFREQLRQPLAGLPDVMDEYRVYQQELDDSLKDSQTQRHKIQEAYRVGIEKWHKRRAYEARVAITLDGLSSLKRLSSAWDDYIRFELSEGSEGHVRVAYLRACDELGHLRTDLWFAWVGYIWDKLGSPNKALLVFDRAVRYHPTNCKLWSSYMICQAVTASDVESIKSIFHRALLADLRHSRDLLEIYITTADCMRRVLKRQEREKEPPAADAFESQPVSASLWEPVREVFKLAEDLFLKKDENRIRSQERGTDGEPVEEKFRARGDNGTEQGVPHGTVLPQRDPLCTIWLNWAGTETFVCKDLKQLQIVGERLLERYSTHSFVWREYINLVRHLTSTKVASHHNMEDSSGAAARAETTIIRDLYRRALAAVQDRSDVVASEWLQFERFFGDGESYRQADREINPSQLSSVEEVDSSKVAHIQAQRDKRRRRFASADSAEGDSCSDASSDVGGEVDSVSSYGSIPKRSRMVSDSPTTSHIYGSRPSHYHYHNRFSMGAHDALGRIHVGNLTGNIFSSPQEGSAPSSPRSRTALGAMAISSSPHILTEDEIERATRATFDGHESSSPSLMPPLPGIQSNQSPVHTWYHGHPKAGGLELPPSVMTGDQAPYVFTRENLTGRKAASTSSSSASHTPPHPETAVSLTMPPPTCTPKKGRRVSVTGKGGISASSSSTDGPVRIVGTVSSNHAPDAGELETRSSESGLSAHAGGSGERHSSSESEITASDSSNAEFETCGGDKSNGCDGPGQLKAKRPKSTDSSTSSSQEQQPPKRRKGGLPEGEAPPQSAENTAAVSDQEMAIGPCEAPVGPRLGKHHLQRKHSRTYMKPEDGSEAPRAIPPDVDTQAIFKAVEADVLPRDLEEEKSVWVSGLDNTVTQNELVKLFKRHTSGVEEVRLVKDFAGRSKGFAYVDFHSHEQAKAATTALDGHMMNERNIKVLLSKPTKAVYEPHTVFVSNLPLNSDNNALQKLFDDGGSLKGRVKDVRLKVDSEGACKGYGYVEFLDDESVALALSLDKKLTLGDSTINVAPSIPMKSHRWIKATKSKVEKRAEANRASEETAVIDTVHVKNLSFKTTEEGMKNHFAQVGEVAEVLLCRGPDGRSKGFGFVKYANQKDSFSALMLNDSELDGRDITVAQSTRAMTHSKQLPGETVKQGKATRYEPKSGDPKTSSSTSFKKGGLRTVQRKHLQLGESNEGSGDANVEMVRCAHDNDNHQDCRRAPP